MLTVADLIADLELPLLAGEANVEFPVRWVHMSELADPTPWLSGGEVLLTTGMQLQSPDVQREFIERLVDRQLAALGFGVGIGFDEVPPALLQAAAERDFPVFEIPYELPFIAVSEAAFTKLVNEEYAVLRRALAAQERLKQIVLTERGIDDLVATLATLLGAAVVLLDARGEILAEHAFRRRLEPGTIASLRDEVRERARRQSGHQFIPSVDDASRSLALAVVADASSGIGPGAPPTAEAWLVAIKDAGPLSDFDRLTLRQASTIVALELLRERIAHDTERRLAGDVLAAIVSGEIEGADLRRRLEPFGLAERVAALVVEHGSGGRGSASLVEAAFADALRAEASAGLIATAGTLVCALVPGFADDDLFSLGERVAERLERDLDRPVVVGAGRAVPGEQARRAYHEARCTLEAITMVHGPGAAGHANGFVNGSSARGAMSARTSSVGGARVATYRDLGSFQLLLSLQDDEALKLFCDSILGPIEASEGPYGGELMRSLEAFIEENGQWERAAKRLFCHRHTLRYRIRRVEELTGRDLGSARDRIEFWLALRGRELVS